MTGVSLQQTLRVIIVLGISIISLSFLFAFVTDSYAIEDRHKDISVTCYKNNSRIGTAIVFPPKVSTSGQLCNSVYYDCQQDCIGCVHDFDYIENVCYDKSRRAFLR